MRMRAFRAIALLGLAAFGSRSQPSRYDLVVTGGTVVDGTGRAAYAADIAIKDGRIVSIGRIGRTAAREAVDARGLTVAPGFIDVHTHADDLAEHPRAENFVRMGVTTIVAGNCGASALDVGEALTAIRDTGASVNYATLVGHNTVRRAVMGPRTAMPRSPNSGG